MDAGIKYEGTHTDLPLVPASGRALGLDRITEQLASRAPSDVAPRGEVHLSKVGRGKGLQGLYEARRPLTSQQTRQPELQQAVRAHPDIVSARAGARAQKGCPRHRSAGQIAGPHASGMRPFHCGCCAGTCELCRPELCPPVQPVIFPAGHVAVTREMMAEQR